MDEIIKMMFGLFGVIVLVYLVNLDKRYPESNPIDTPVYWILGGYIVFVFAGPGAVRSGLKKAIDNRSNFKISFKRKDE